MRVKTNIIFSIICGLLCFAGAVLFIQMGEYVIGGLFFSGFILFSAIFLQNNKKRKLYLNPYNALPSVDEKVSEETVKQRLKKNLLSYGFELRDGFYVSTKNKDYDVYFSTYDKDNVNARIGAVTELLRKDGAYLSEMLSYGGYTKKPVDLDMLKQTLVNNVERYDNARLYTPKKLSYVILVGFFDHTEPKPMYSFWLLPFNSVNSVDQLDFVDISVTDGIARLNTTAFERNPSMRGQIRRIFKGVVDFDEDFSPELLPEAADDTDE